ncbi:MAG TPA: hypothetical protein VFQ65_27085 [Kofleriaceae bacterium]|nr:hypothetical protein [Kofleriaceae bacterium]
MSAFASHGCYLGQNPTGRKIAYAVNGALVAGGIVVASIPDPHDCFCIVTNAQVGAVPALIGLGGLLLNLVLSDHSMDPPAPTP